MKQSFIIALDALLCDAHDMVDVDGLLGELTAEGEDLEAIVTGIGPDGWATATPAPGWTVAHQVAHLCWTDEAALEAVTDGDAFAARVQAALADMDGFVDAGAEALVALGPAQLTERWRAGRAALVAALAQVPEGTKLAWFGPAMSVASMATARLMETWAHGQDVADALGVERTPTTRLRNVAHLGVRTRDYSYVNRGLEPPAEPFRVELDAPDGTTWTWGPDDAAQRVTGPAVDFCLLVTCRRHPDDLDLGFTGEDAGRWSTIAQAFAGPPGEGPRPDGPRP